MTRQQFGAELSQYLTFVSPEQRDKIVAYYDQLLEQVGPEGEFELFKQIGTPMTVAIAMKRHLEANEPLLPEEAEALPQAPTMVKFEQPVSDEAQEAPATQVARPIDEPSPAAEPEAQAQSPAEEPAETVAQSAPEAAEPEVPAAQESPEPEAQPEVAEPEAAEAEAPAEEPAQPEEKPAAAVYEKPKMTFGRFLGAIGIGILSVCIIAFFCSVTAVGGVLLVSGAQIFMAGLGITGYLTDCLMTVGGGAVIFGLGLLLAWFAIWCAIRLIGDMIRSFNKQPDSEKTGLSTTWKLIWVLVLIFIIAGGICFGVSLFMGGDINTLTGSDSFATFINRMTPSHYVDYINANNIFG